MASQLYKCFLNCRFMTTCKAIIDTYKTAKFFLLRQGPGYNTQFLLYPRPLTWREEFCCFVSIMSLTRCCKTTVFLTFIFAVFLLNLFYRCILSHKPIYGFVKTNWSHIHKNLNRFFCKSNQWRRSLTVDVVKIFKMAAVDVANQLPVPVW